jgi:hypothetical protein
MEEARRHIRRLCPSWTDLSPGDPGTTILEVFAYLTEALIFRLNRVPEKAYIEFLRLLGVTLAPPSAAAVTLRFYRERSATSAVTIPRGTRVTIGRGGSETPVFTTSRAVVLEPEETEVLVPAHHADLIEGELVGVGTGTPGHTVRAARPPIVASTGEDLDLVVAIECDPTELGELDRAIEHQGKAYRVWREVEHFVDLDERDRFVYVADRTAGTITFAPRARMTPATEATDDPPAGLGQVGRELAAIVPAGAEIRLWYRSGGGPEGNVAADTLTTLKDPIRGLEVTNPEAATGGREGESLENALVRGPQELHSLRRTVTARDYELVAIRSSGAVGRARAFTKAAVWAHARPGTVEVILVPHLADPERVTLEQLVSRQTSDALEQITEILDARRPLGTDCEVTWAHFKPVAVRARIVVYREEDQEAVKSRVLKRLHQLINPLPAAGSPGWRFGEALRSSHIFDIVLEEPGVSYVDRVRMVVGAAPDSNVDVVALDHHQRSRVGGVQEPRRTWYAGKGDTLYRSVDDGVGWETTGRFDGERIRWVGSHPQIPGLLAVMTSVEDEEGSDQERSAIHISRDCGESWVRHGRLGFRVHDAEWILRDGRAVLLLASTVGLYELSAAQPNPVQVPVVAEDPDLGFFAVTAASDARGAVTVALGAENKRGVYVSSRSGEPDTFRLVGLEGRWIRSLAVQYAGPLVFLWAGPWVDSPEQEGDGCFRMRLRSWADETDDEGLERWEPYARGWKGGSCYSLAVVGSAVLAGTHRAGVLTLDAAAPVPAWAAPELDCNLPLRDVGRFHPVESLAATPTVVMVGGAEGVYRSRDGGQTYYDCSGRTFTEAVTLPETWLFCSGEHEVQVVSENEAEQDG